MTEGDADFWKPTADLFAKLFQKPPMTQKLLAKPPFRYLHDIVTSTMKATGFAPNLFQAEELDSNLVSSKEAKIAFLDKLIDFVNKCTGKKFDVKANKIVAGLEPEKTNTLLQHLHLAATKRLDMPGESVAPQEKKKEEPKKPEPKKEEPKKEEPKKEDPKKESPKKEPKEEPKKKEEAKKKEEPKKPEPKKEIKKEAPKKVEPKKEEPKKEVPSTIKIDSSKEEAPKVIPKEPEIKKPVIEPNEDEDNENINKPVNQPAAILPTEALGKIAKEAIKEIEVDNKPPEVENKEKSGFRFGSLKGKSKTKENKEVEKILQDKDIITDPKNLGILKEAIQGLTKSTNPLGKSMDFILEDIDTMTKEYELWRKQYISSMAQVEEQSKITEEKLQPLQDRLAEVEEQIKEQHVKIATTKGKIIKNEEQIQTMVLNFATPKS